VGTGSRTPIVNNRMNENTSNNKNISNFNKTEQEVAGKLEGLIKSTLSMIVKLFIYR
jgi:hypothetical protein